MLVQEFGITVRTVRLHDAHLIEVTTSSLARGNRFKNATHVEAWGDDGAVELIYLRFLKAGEESKAAVPVAEYRGHYAFIVYGIPDHLSRVLDAVEERGARLVGVLDRKGFVKVNVRDVVEV